MFENDRRLLGGGFVCYAVEEHTLPAQEWL